MRVWVSVAELAMLLVVFLMVVLVAVFGGGGGGGGGGVLCQSSPGIELGSHRSQILCSDSFFVPQLVLVRLLFLVDQSCERAGSPIDFRLI